MFLSIITVTYNDAKNLSSTIDSVRTIKNSETEFIVIDGQSDDNTRKIVQANIDLIDCFVSEPDKGVFDAMNKGINIASGRFLIFMNAGDTFASDDFLDDLKEREKVALIYGDTHYLVHGTKTPFPTSSLKYGMIMACHQSMFFNKKILQEELYYDKVRFFAEYDLVVRIVKKYKIEYIPKVIANFLGGGLSSEVNTTARKLKYSYLWKHYGLSGALRGIGERFGVFTLPKRI